MRFFFIGLIVIFLASMLIGQLTTPKKTPFRKVFAKGLYYSVIGLIGFIIAIGIVTFVNDITSRKGSENDFSRMTKEQRTAIRDSLRKELPTQTEEILKADMVDFNFNGVLIPCYETVRKLNVASLNEIESFTVGERTINDGTYVVEVKAELKVNQPVTGFQMTGTFNFIYDFIEGDSDFDPGWEFSKILITDCQVLAAEGEEQKPGQEELYPDLPRK